MTTVTFYFDFVSAYSWLALEQAEAFAAEHAVEWRMRPVLLAALLENADRKASGQIDAMRAYSATDLAREAARLGIPLAGPPAHPFLSLTALRVHAVHQDGASAVALARAIAHRGWSLGEDLTRAETIETALEDAGLPAAGVIAQAETPAIKDLLRANTTEAGALGVFGAPTFVLDGELFWGQDRLPALARRAGGEPRPDPNSMLRSLGLHTRGELER